MKHKPMEWKAKFLAIAIAIVFAAFVFIGINTFNPGPEWEDYCGEIYIEPHQINTSAQCEEVGGYWNSDRYPKRVAGPVGEPGWCDFEKECRDAYNDADESHKQIVFLISVALGLIALIGSLGIGAGSVSAGLMAGGILTMFIGIMQYWDKLGDYLRFILLGIVLVILIWVGYKKLK